MFVSKNQFTIVLVCIFFGITSGVLFEIFFPIIKRIKNPFIKNSVIIFLYILSAGLFVIGSYRMFFPSLRFYMIAGFFFGKLIYDKSLGIIVAKFVKKIYNKIRKIITKRREKDYDGKQV